MKTLLTCISVFLVLSLTMATAQTRAKGYYRKDGTYVRPYYRAAEGDTDDISLNTKKSARGNSSSYMDNYHRVYRGDHSNERYQNYNTLLRHNNYGDIAMGESSTITNNRGNTIGYLHYHEDGVFKVLDSDSIHIGYVKLTSDRKRVRVYDSYGYHVITKSIEK